MSTKRGVECDPNDPDRQFWGDGETLDGFEFRCTRHPGQEVFIASVPGMMSPDIEEPLGGFNLGNEPDSVDFQVLKTGENTNRFSDGTVGVPKWAHEFNDACDPTDLTCGKMGCGRRARLWDLRRKEWAKQ